MAYEELDKWIDANAPSLNKRVLHTKVASISGSEPGDGGMTMIDMDTSIPGPPRILNGASVKALLENGTFIVFRAQGGGSGYMYLYPGELHESELSLLTTGESQDSPVVYHFFYNSESDDWAMNISN